MILEFHVARATVSGIRMAPRIMFRHRAPITAFTLLAIITFWAYAPALRGEFLWDDALLVKANTALRDAEGLRTIWLSPGATPQYYPIVHTSFWIEYHLWRLDTFGFHVVNVALHLVNALLAGVLLRRLGVRGAPFAAMIFALHPFHAETVAWISERKNLLSGLFFLGALLAAARAFDLAPRDEESGVESRRPIEKRSYAVAMLLFACALLSKTVTCTLPAALAVLIWWRRGRIARAEWLALLPMVALGAGAGALAVWVEHEDVGAKGAEWSFSAAERVLIAARAVVFYASKLALPTRLAFIYPRWEVDAADVRAYGYAAGVALVTAAAWAARARAGRGPLAAWLCFLIVLSPALGFVNFYPMRYTFVADHFQYLASLAGIAAGSALVARAAARARWAGALGIAALAIVLGVATRGEARKYASQDALWRDTVAKSPTSALAQNNFGRVAFARGRLAEAREAFAAAARLDPRSPEAFFNWGSVLAAEGAIDEAVAKYEEAARAGPEWPLPARTLAWIHATSDDARFRDAARALTLADDACRLTRNADPLALDAKAAALAAAGRFDEAARTANAAAALATRGGKPRLAREIESRAALYRSGRAFVAPVVEPEPAP